MKKQLLLWLLATILFVSLLLIALPILGKENYATQDLLITVITIFSIALVIGVISLVAGLLFALIPYKKQRYPDKFMFTHSQ